jgi:hypothetical protein
VIGAVEHVLEVPELEVFDDQVADITDRDVVLNLNLPVEETGRLGRPQAPPAYHADPSEDAGGSLHDWFGPSFGRGHWRRDD